MFPTDAQRDMRTTCLLNRKIETPLTVTFGTLHFLNIDPHPHQSCIQHPRYYRGVCKLMFKQMHKITSQFPTFCGNHVPTIGSSASARAKFMAFSGYLWTTSGRKIWVRQLGWWHSVYMEKNVPNHQCIYISVIVLNKSMHEDQHDTLSRVSMHCSHVDHASKWPIGVPALLHQPRDADLAGNLNGDEVIPLNVMLVGSCYPI
jgi:hypothetical protein